MNQGLYNERQLQMIEWVNQEGEVKVHTLREHFQVTEMTIRRDLEKLEQHGVLRRTFGGAIATGKDIALRERSEYLLEEKMKIGKLAASFVHKGASIFIDGGTTTFQVAKYLTPEMELTVVTNALNVAAQLADKKIQTIMVGGTIVEATYSLIGPLAMEAIDRFAFDQAFIGATGLNMDHGFSNSNMYEAELKSKVIRHTKETNIVVDHSKFGEKNLISFARLQQVQRIVTDRKPEKQWLGQCQEAGVQIAFQ